MNALPREKCVYAVTLENGETRYYFRVFFCFYLNIKNTDLCMTMSAVNFKWHINLSFNPDSLLALTSGKTCLTCPSIPLPL